MSGEQVVAANVAVHGEVTLLPKSRRRSRPVQAVGVTPQVALEVLHDSIGMAARHGVAVSYAPLHDNGRPLIILAIQATICQNGHWFLDSSCQKCR